MSVQIILTCCVMKKSKMINNYRLKKNLTHSLSQLSCFIWVLWEQEF
jgi:hypothetical protein